MTVTTLPTMGEKVNLQQNLSIFGRGSELCFTGRLKTSVIVMFQYSQLVIHHFPSANLSAIRMELTSMTPHPTSINQENLEASFSD